MDTKLYNGDFETDERGIPRSIDGIVEQLQSAFILISVPKGAFAYDRSLGGNRIFLSAYGEANTPDGARVMAENAVAERLDCKILSAETGTDSIKYEVMTPLGKGSFLVKI